MVDNENPEIRYLGDVQRLVLKPGDRVVLTVDREITREEYEYLTRLLSEKLRGHDVLVIGKGMQISVLGEAA